MPVIVRYSEIGLKGKNKSFFEKRLVKNIIDCLKTNNISFDKIIRSFSRIIIFTEEKCRYLKNVFGIKSFSYAIETNADIESINNSAINLIQGISKKNTFRITCFRLDKSINLTSLEIEKYLGSFVIQKTGAKAKMKGFDFNIFVETINKKAYLYLEKIYCFGGLPVGVSGKVIALIEDNASILAALFVLKRGCEIIPVGLNKTKIDISLLKKFSYGSKIELEEISKINDVDEIQGVIKKHNAKAVVVNDSLHPVINLKGIFVLRPLIAFDKNEIEERLNEFKR